MHRFSHLARIALTSTLTVVLLLMAQSQTISQDSTYIRQHYVKYEYQIPMRDGVKLFTSVYVPKDKSKTYPIILKRTP
ncbi:MAG: X-Pro dipeptidyl-peptidase, partial [bacterium]